MTTVFICIDWFSPAYKAGGPVQSIANLVTQFRRPDTCFKILCSNTDLGGDLLQEPPFDTWVNFNAYTQVWYASKATQKIRVLKNEIERSAPDILFINGIFSWYFNIVPLLFCKIPRKIVSARGMLHPAALAQKPFKKKIYLWCWKILGLQHRCRFHASNEDEKLFIQNIFGKQTTVFVAANFPRVFSMQATPSKKPGTLQLVSVGLISPMKNYLRVLQELTHCTQNISYDIYGPVKDHGYWQACLLQVNQLPLNIRVNYHGDIEPAQIATALLNAHVFILPSKSENFGHAIYEALSAGKPVITSNGTPWMGLYNQKAGMNIAIEKDGELGDAIRFFAEMPDEEMDDWHKGAREYALNSIDFDAIKKQYETMFGQPGGIAVV
ncbi:MAG: glycosyltransferase [Ferruginibacter sp.]|nr:glycosyltransferase [Ferruginibacter sp.]